MSETKTYTETEAERFFAVNFHGMTWDLLGKTNRTLEDNEEMIDYAHSSLAHWRKAGKEINLQRGYWLLSRVYSVIKKVDPCVEYAIRCQKVTNDFPDQMEDFDIAFSFEALARAHALAGNKDEFLKYHKMAKDTGKSIKKDDDRKVFEDDLNSGDWFGFK